MVPSNGRRTIAHHDAGVWMLRFAAALNPPINMDHAQFGNLFVVGNDGR